MYEIYVGIDDTDSPEGMCTTYISCVIINKLKDFGYNIKGYPKLIRLNPFARFKTRGNGAVTFKLIVNNFSSLPEVKKIILDAVEEFSHIENDNTNPGVIFYHGEITENLKSFSTKTIQSIVTISEAKKLAEEIGAEIHQFKKGRGIIGALAAIGCLLNDSTFELLSYRVPENYGAPRKINEDSVILMNEKTYPQTFDNIDNGYMAIEPHTPCPILYGIRGESPQAVLEAHNLIEIHEPLEGYCIFETNQHTDMHIQKIDKISEMEQFGCYQIEGSVKDVPHVIEGGHIFFYLEDDSGKIECAAYEPTKGFRNIIKKLRPGDEVVLYGGIGTHQTLNIEKIQIKKLEYQFEEKNPVCECGKRMKSAGSDKGFKCPKCGFKLRDGSKILNPVKRDLKPGSYEVPPSARRHLSKQLVRMGKS
ncbi:tRNA(Ile)(2)-agmatinylcytidine synthase [Methanobacterium alcaliphilum]|uniref:tRNA(Ile)(2)-agmatinylcytidine synthase n=1 Tax=Methanobacterium alcaliphilum TaxID=392018 RepID=UPI00200A7E38|nr:tRNA(Ile)(2)-agmatinylcytidine synthase [Methanobacterium alcaliphilum]MCK9150328.1 tRNA(Ile)(2)-agmatinylcytidine synthase [Methanobacterium alcaliphilum]